MTVEIISSMGPGRDLYREVWICRRTRYQLRL